MTMQRFRDIDNSDTTPDFREGHVGDTFPRYRQFGHDAHTHAHAHGAAAFGHQPTGSSSATGPPSPPDPSRSRTASVVGRTDGALSPGVAERARMNSPSGLWNCDEIGRQEAGAADEAE